MNIIVQKVFGRLGFILLFLMIIIRLNGQVHVTGTVVSAFENAALCRGNCVGKRNHQWSCNRFKRELRN